MKVTTGIVKKKNPLPIYSFIFFLRREHCFLLDRHQYQMYFYAFLPSCSEDCSVSCKYSWDELQSLCRRQKLVCKQLVVTEVDFNDYVVDYLCNYRKIKVSEH